jgi:hypothetical protein
MEMSKGGRGKSAEGQSLRIRGREVWNAAVVNDPLVAVVGPWWQHGLRGLEGFVGIGKPPEKVSIVLAGVNYKKRGDRK